MIEQENFLADENIPRLVILQLRELGFNVISITETSPSIKDTEVISMATHLDTIILTADKDFGELAFKHSLPVPGIILLRLGGLTPDEMAHITCTALIKHLNWRGSISVITKDAIKIRSLP
jgi:predicted nuclease of predicted toxin-antitoxin system